MNACHFTVTLVADPELRTLRDGKIKCQFRGAVGRRPKPQDNGAKPPKDRTAFLDFEAWDTGAEKICQWFKKGDNLLVHCSIFQDNWEAEGQRRSRLIFRVNEFEFPPFGRDRREGAPETKTVTPQTVPAERSVDPFEEDGIPF